MRPRNILTAAKDERQFASADMQYDTFTEFLSWLDFVATKESGSSHVKWRHIPTGVGIDVAKSSQTEGVGNPRRRQQSALHGFGKMFGFPMGGQKVASKLWRLRLAGGWKGTGRPPPMWWDVKRWQASGGMWWDDPWWRTEMLGEEPVQAPVEKWDHVELSEIDIAGDIATLAFRGISGWYWVPLRDLPRRPVIGERLEMRPVEGGGEPPGLPGMGLKQIQVRRPAAVFARTAGWLARAAAADEV